MKHLSLFSGIGGFDLAAEWMGWENISHTEWNEFGQKVLKYHWPNAQSHGDITKTDYTIYRGRVDILTGGFPCQPYSVAGKRKGKDDERHLWPEMLRAIREIAPRWVVGENVGGLINWNGGVVFDEVQADLEAEGYEILPFLLPAAGVNAPHKRDRIWFVAYANNKGRASRLREVSQAHGEISQWHENAKPCNTCVARFATDTNHDGSYGAENRKGLEKGDGSNETRKNETIQFEGCSNTCAASAALAQGEGSRGQLQQQSRKGQLRGCDSCIKGLSPNTTSTRQPGEEHGETESGWIAEKSIRDDWQNFPTQSPVCDGDDGFPSESLRQFFRDDSNGVISEEEIDKILSSAYTQWRNETIKAGGNAIVPHVVYQIFKAIEQYENKSHDPHKIQPRNTPQNTNRCPGA